jgi:hypothetical protein
LGICRLAIGRDPCGIRVYTDRDSSVGERYEIHGEDLHVFASIGLVGAVATRLPDVEKPGDCLP